MARLDHLVVTAATLAEGVAHVRAQLGVGLVPGGRHPRMGTHNCLLRLGPAVYLEVLAIDPDGGVAQGPRWFQLDRGGPPRLATWVARTGALRAALAAWPDYGRIEAMERGALRWDITLPEGGAMPFDGIAPTLIQWRGEGRPAALLPDSGCTLVRLEGRHPEPEAVASLLQGIGFKGDFSVGKGAPGLLARIQTPDGVRTLG